MSKSYKQTALDALRGNWKTAMLTGFVASLFGANTIYSASNNFNRSSDDSELGQQILEYFRSPAGQKILGITLAILGVAAILLIVSIFISGAMRLGYARFNMNLIDHNPAAFSDLFTYMNYKWKGFCMNFLQGLYLGLWSLLLVIPGIVKSFSYAMTPFILAENPEMSADDAITESRNLMDGHKWDLFYLSLSFLGWGILVTLPGLAVLFWGIFRGVQGNGDIGSMIISVGIAIVLITICNIPLQPYREAAQAAFYRDISAKPEESETEWYQPE